MDPPMHTLTPGSYGTLPSPTPVQPAASPSDGVGPYVAEFIGTFMLVFTVCVCNITGSLIWNSTAVGVAYAALVCIFGRASGGQFNPAVSLACAAARRMPWRRALGYLVVQLAGGLLASWVAADALVAPAAPAPAPGAPMAYPWVYASALELLYTAALCVVVLRCSDPLGGASGKAGEEPGIHGLAAGLMLVGGGYAASSVSGGFFNPALTLATDVWGEGGTPSIDGWWRAVYLVAQFAGALLAVLFSQALGQPDPAALVAARAPLEQRPGLVQQTGGLLRVRVQHGCNLRNRDSGIMGDVSDPYVNIRVGLRQERTATISNSLNPVWNQDNAFSFNLLPSGPAQLILEVMNDNVVLKDQCLGTAVVNVPEVVPGEWIARRERLVDGRGGELAFEVKLELPSLAAAASGPIVQPSVGAQLLGELLGTFLLALSLGLLIVTKSPATGWALAALYASLLYALGDSSSGCFNPAITAAMVLACRERSSLPFGLVCMTVQLGAGILAGLVFAAFHSVGPYKQDLFGLAPGASVVLSDGTEYAWSICYGAESIFTFLLAYVALAVAPSSTQPRLPPQAPLALGASVAAGFYAVNAISGGLLNPALCFGLAASSWALPGGGLAPPPWTNAVAFGSVELLAALAAVLVGALTLPVKAEALRD